MNKFSSLLLTVALIATVFAASSEAGRLRRQSGQCNSFCTFQYDPVCGKSGGTTKTFSNQCAFDNEKCLNSAWSLVRKGSCEDNE